MSVELYRDSRDWAEHHRHPQPDDRMLALTAAAALRDMADRIDRGPAVPLPPSVISTLVRERATDLARSADDHVDEVPPTA